MGSDFPLFGAFAASATSGQFLLWEHNRVKISMDGLMHGKKPWLTAVGYAY